MEDYSFRDKYKKITDLPILANHQLGIPLLKAIHYYLFEDDKIDNSIRYSSDSYIYQTISTRMEEIFELIN